MIPSSLKFDSEMFTVGQFFPVTFVDLETKHWKNTGDTAVFYLNRTPSKIEAITLMKAVAKDKPDEFDVCTRDEKLVIRMWWD